MKTILGTDQLHTIRTAAETLRVSPRFIRQLVADEMIPVLRLGPRKVRIRPRDLDQFIETGATGARTPMRRRK